MGETMVNPHQWSDLPRKELISDLAKRILNLRRPHPTRVAIDGVDAAGKSFLADSLVPILAESGRSIIRASIDGFHRPRAERNRRGSTSPEGYFYDSFQYDALCAELLLSLGPGGSRTYRTAIFDYRTDMPIAEPVLSAAKDAILLFDGVFLLRPELTSYWDFSIFVHADFEVALQRALKRDTALFGSADATRYRYEERYIPGQRLYLELIKPWTLANVVIDNNDFEHPRLRQSKGDPDVEF